MRRGPHPAALVAAGLVAGLVATGVGCTDDDDAGGAGSTTSTSEVRATPGAPGVGDPYFPELGNGGYDVRHYRLRLDWDGRGRLGGVARIEMTATQDLSGFDLDLAGLDVARVTVGDAEVPFAREGNELVVTLPEPIPEDETFVTTVAYGGVPRPLDEATDYFDPGWQTDGAEAFVVAEPGGARTFFPANDHPSDKATFTIVVGAPAEMTVAANGTLVGQPELEEGGARAWTYEVTEPMATYLVQVGIGDLELVDAGTVEGVRIRHALHRSFLEEARGTVSRTGEMLRLLDDVWGPYPFAAYGVLAVDEPLGFALETQTLTLIGSDTATDGRRSDPLLLHELAHQWVGNAVSPATWKDIWLNEGFATYSEWLWFERTVGSPAAGFARRISGPGNDVPPGDPGPDELFGTSVYERGAATLQALREAVGDDAFFRILRTWVDRHRGGVASTPELVALAEEISGNGDLDALFQRWLYEPGLPTLD
ncbi:MAG TPA: M1 family metallopeptidase [Acidimicrobiales bacterium]|nr:M1 family metallopeptidase [Acidimicrobiales bacterium]